MALPRSSSSSHCRDSPPAELPRPANINNHQLPPEVHHGILRHHRRLKDMGSHRLLHSSTEEEARDMVRRWAALLLLSLTDIKAPHKVDRRLVHRKIGERRPLVHHKTGEDRLLDRRRIGEDRRLDRLQVGEDRRSRNMAGLLSR